MTREQLYEGLSIDRRIRDYEQSIELLSGKDPLVIEALKIAGQSDGIKYFSDEEHLPLVEGIKKLLLEQVNKLKEKMAAL